MISMKNCPFCSAEIQENAQFCLYCMKPLSEKETITKKKKKLWPLLVVLLVTAVAVALVLSSAVGIVLLITAKDSNEPSDIVPEETTNETTTAGSDEVSKERIVSYADFRLQALMATAKLGYNELWNPEELIETHEAFRGWSLYSCKINIPEADLKILFFNDGEEILTVISDVTDETFKDAVCLYECILSGVENYTFTNFQQMMFDTDTYPMKVSEEKKSLLEDIGIIDAGSSKIDDGTSAVTMYRWSTAGENTNLLYELRTRTYNGRTYYDIYMYNTIE